LDAITADWKNTQWPRCSHTAPNTTALHWAITNKNPALVKQLCNRANDNLLHTVDNLGYEYNMDGRTPMEHAVALAVANSDKQSTPDLTAIKELSHSYPRFLETTVLAECNKQQNFTLLNDILASDIVIDPNSLGEIIMAALEMKSYYETCAIVK